MIAPVDPYVAHVLAAVEAAEKRARDDATAEMHREDQRRRDELASVPG